jgi:hypothetical protein
MKYSGPELFFSGWFGKPDSSACAQACSSVRATSRENLFANRRCRRLDEAVSAPGNKVRNISIVPFRMRVLL